MIRSTAFLLIASAAALMADGVAGIKWTPPATWKAEGPRPMRAASYNVPAAAGDSEGAECVAYFFGAGQGGSISANIERWKAQFQMPDGKPNTAVKSGKKAVRGIQITTVEASGNYTGMGGPMAESKTVKHNYRLVGAIVEAPQGNVFFKFTGPAKTVAAHLADFDKMIASIEK